MRRPLPVIMFPLALLTLGCTALPIAPGQDKFVVTAERELANSVDTVHTFWLIDNQNHDFMVQKLPQVHEFAQKTRREFWTNYYDPAIVAVRTYKRTRDPIDAGAQEDRLKAIRDLVAQVRQALLQVRTAQAVPAAAVR